MTVKCLHNCKYYKKHKDNYGKHCYCTYEYANELHHYRTIPYDKTSEKPPLWCPLRKKENKDKK